ncbi:hypothetical protein JQ594_15300 [Bradyrhizobium manausense]|uniref:hypothetical protein n=1 Tax=Bradyrhizobium manausense TaxID=989370 RepID=UPI001BA44480|nr:hypothetical protein [Bradyrhizobium manausense]MBR0687296.1 hypothetical protein [Bradyrhizobium manausense]
MSKPADQVHGHAQGWHNSNWDEAKSAGRILLIWKTAAGLSEHVELGKWSGSAWTNTYGKPFFGDPDGWAPLKPFASQPPAAPVEFDSLAGARKQAMEDHASMLPRSSAGSAEVTEDTLIMTPIDQLALAMVNGERERHCLDALPPGALHDPYYDRVKGYASVILRKYMVVTFNGVKL